MKIIYRVDIDGKVQLQNDEHNTLAEMKHAAQRLGYVVTEFDMYVEDEKVDVAALTPDTIMASERIKMERNVIQCFPRLKKVKRIKL